MYRIGVDIGGTFTDFTVVDEDGRFTLYKEPTTPDEPTRAIERGLAAVAERMGLEQADLLARTRLFVHGTTIATNQVIQRNGPEIGLLCTEGFRDVLYLRDGFKPERFNIRLPHPVEFVERSLRLGVPERIGPDGAVRTPLDEQAVRDAAATFRERGVRAVAVAFLWSIVNDAHERRAAELLAEELPGVHVLTSADVLPEIREWERTSAAVLSAYIAPGIDEYLRRLERILDEAGLQRRPLIMQINGGCASVEEILHRPVYALGSGPAAAPAAALNDALALGIRDLITVDMGGTSFDVALIREGRPAMSRTIQVDMQPIGVAAVDVHSIAAGGGSIAHVDDGGMLHVGPQSAGAAPGPACYGAGGERPTVTDANVVLGYLDPDAFLGGRRRLDSDRSRAAIDRDVAEPLGLETTDAAAGIIRVVTENMVSAIRAVSIERGIDPRGYTLVCGGGAGGLHAARLARELGMAQVLIPRAAGTLCSYGMTVTDVRHDHVRPFHATSDAVDCAQLDALFAELEQEARESLARDGFTPEQIVLERQVDTRYQGQVYELTVPVPSVGTFSPADVAEIAAGFHEEHRRQFTYARPEMAVEFLHWRVVAVGRIPLAKAPERAVEEAVEVQSGRRDAYVPELGGMAPVAVVEAAALVPGAVVRGPAVIESDTTTVLLNPGDRLSVTHDGTLVIDVERSESASALATAAAGA